MRVPVVLLACVVGELRIETDPVTLNPVFTHLQKKSRCGFLLTWPFCFHVWFFWRKQKQNKKGWRPGTEQGIYGRTPGWRYDYDLGMIRTNGYLGGHWD